MKKQYRPLVLVLLVLAFVLLDLSVFLLYTRRCLPDTTPGMQAKSIELDEYLPFAEQTKIVKQKADLSLAPEYPLPVLDSAAALYPVASAFAYALYTPADVAFNGTDFTPESRLQMNNTRTAYKAIVDGTTDIALLAKPSAEQLAYAAEQGVALKLTPIGREAFVFLVNANNPVNDLTVQQVYGIYTGQYTRWSQLGGQNRAILALQRNAGSGSQTSFLSFIEKNRVSEKDKVVDTSADPFGSCIGFSFRYYVVDVVKNGGVKMLALNGIAPTRENIAAGTYPIVSNFYAVTREDDTNPNVQAVLDWILSPQGQQIIDATGFVGLEG